MSSYIWAQSREGELEVGILRPRVNKVVNLCDLSVLIVHLLSRAAKVPPTDVTVVAQSSGRRILWANARVIRVVCLHSQSFGRWRDSNDLKVKVRLFSPKTLS